MPQICDTPITSLQNRRIKDARKLVHRKARAQQQRFLVEGLQPLTMGLDAGIPVHEVFYCEELFRSTVAEVVLARFAQTGADLVPVSRDVMRHLASQDRFCEIAATFALPWTQPDSLDLSRTGLVLALDRVRKPGNVGMLVRTADAVGAAGMALLGPCADPCHPDAVRGSMGSIFTVPIAQIDIPDAFFEKLRCHGYRIVATDPHEHAVDGSNLWEGRVALVLGNEGEGLSSEVRRSTDATVRLPMVGKAESLNVAVAGSVLMYAWFLHATGGLPNAD